MLLAVVGLKAEAKIAEGPGVVVVIGGSGADLDRRLEQAMKAHTPSALLSFGVTGALDPALAVGDLVAATGVKGDGLDIACDRDWAAALAKTTGARPALVAASNKAADTVAAKRSLFKSTGAAIVDMESHTVALAAREAKIPFTVLRAVSDAADTALPSAVLAGWRPDGGMDPLAVLMAALRKPGELPGVIRAGGEFNRALKRLKAARAAAGPSFARPG